MQISLPVWSPGAPPWASPRSLLSAVTTLPSPTKISVWLALTRMSPRRSLSLEKSYRLKPAPPSAEPSFAVLNRVSPTL